MAPRYRLKLSKLDFVSAVDVPAQETATVAIIKRDGRDEVTARCRVAKVDATLGIVLGWALTTTVDGEPYFDLQGDAIAEDDIVKVAADFLAAGGHTDEMHDGEPDGRVVFLWPMTGEIAKALDIETTKTGLLVGIKPSPAVLEKFLDGTYTGFSIGGVGEREQVAKLKCAKCSGYVAKDDVACSACGAPLPKKRAPRATKRATTIKKHAYLTSETLGHSHLLDHDDGQAAGYTDSASVAGGVAYHSHPWVSSDDGTFVLGAAEGHTHGVAGRDAINDAAAAANDDAAGLTPPLDPDGDTVTKQEHAMPTDPKLEKITKDPAKFLKKLEDADAEIERLKKKYSMSDAQRALYKSLDRDDDKAAFLEKTDAERDADVAKSLEADPVVVEFDGVSYRKSAGAATIALAKRSKEQAETLAKRDVELEQERLAKRASAELGNLPGETATKVALLKAIDAIADEETRKGAKALVSAGNHAMSPAFKSLGIGQDAVVEGDPQAHLDALTKKVATEKGLKTPLAMAEVLKTDEGRRLYAAIEKRKQPSSN